MLVHGACTWCLVVQEVERLYSSCRVPHDAFLPLYSVPKTTYICTGCQPTLRCMNGTSRCLPGQPWARVLPTCWMMP